MSKWKGFTKESKFYMGYPGWKREGDLYCEGTWQPRMMGDDELQVWRKDHFKNKIQFWLAFPRAFLIYHFSVLMDTIHRK